MQRRKAFAGAISTLAGYGYSARVSSCETGGPAKFEAIVNQGAEQRVFRTEASADVLIWLDGFTAGVAAAANIREAEANPK